MDPARYALIFYAGGHGGVFDFPHASGLQRLGSSIDQNGGRIEDKQRGKSLFR